MTAREGLLYSESHEWIKKEGEGYLVGLTDYAVKELGDIVFIDLPSQGDETTVGESICEIESVKAVSEIIAPITGSIAEVNEELSDAPEQISEKPYESWLFNIEGSLQDGLMSAEEYSAFCENL